MYRQRLVLRYHMIMLKRNLYYTWLYHVSLLYKSDRLSPRRITVNTNHLYNICTILGQRRIRWANIVQMLYKCFVFTGMYPVCFIYERTWVVKLDIKPKCIVITIIHYCFDKPTSRYLTNTFASALVIVISTHILLF